MYFINIHIILLLVSSMINYSQRFVLYFALFAIKFQKIMWKRAAHDTTIYIRTNIGKGMTAR